MDIVISFEEVILDDSPVYVAFPDDEIFAEVVGVGESADEARRDLIQTFNQMMYSENDVPILMGDKKGQGRSSAALSWLLTLSGFSWERHSNTDLPLSSRQLIGLCHHWLHLYWIFSRCSLYRLLHPI